MNCKIITFIVLVYTLGVDSQSLLFSTNVNIGGLVTCISFYDSSFNSNIFTPWTTYHLFTNITYNYINYTHVDLIINGYKYNFTYEDYQGFLINGEPQLCDESASTPELLPKYIWFNISNEIMLFPTNNTIFNFQNGLVILLFNNSCWNCYLNTKSPQLHLESPSLDSLDQCSEFILTPNACPINIANYNYLLSDSDCGLPLNNNPVGEIYIDGYIPKYITRYPLVYQSISQYGNVPNIPGCFIENEGEQIFVGDNFITTNTPLYNIYFKENLVAAEGVGLSCTKLYDFYGVVNNSVGNYGTNSPVNGSTCDTCLKSDVAKQNRIGTYLIIINTLIIMGLQILIIL
jgi:hypothetical protein